MQILRRENPLFIRGLSLWQRINYFNTMASYLFSYQHLLFYLAPSLYLLFGLSPIAVGQRGAIGVFASYIALSLLIYKAMTAPHGRLLLGEIFRILNLPVFLLASLTLIEPAGLKFSVTPKGDHGGLPWPFMAVPVLLLLVSLTAAGSGLRAALMGPEVHMGAQLLTIGFAMYFALAAAVSLMHAFERRETIDFFSFPAKVKAKLAIGKKREVALIERLNQSHAFVRNSTAALPGTAMHLDIPTLGLRRLSVKVTGVAQGNNPAGRPVLKLAFEHLKSEHRGVLDAYFIESAIPLFFSRFENTPPGPAPATCRTQQPVIAGAAEDVSGGIDETLLPLRGGML